MNTRLPAALPLAALAVLAAAVPFTHAANFQSLIERSPFAPPGQITLGGDAPAEQGVLEFRSVVNDADGVHYSVFDTTANKGYWLTATTTDKPIKVRSYDAASNTLEVEQNGKPVKLALKRAVIQAGQSVAAMIPAAQPTPTPGNPGGNRPNRGNNGEQAAPANPEATARRLEAVAAEVRRRRALRNAANPGANPSPAPANAPAAPAAPAAPVQ